MVPDDVSPEMRAALLGPAIMGPPIVWLASDEAEGIHGERIIVVRLDTPGLRPQRACAQELELPGGRQADERGRLPRRSGRHDSYKGRVVDYFCGRTFRIVLLRGIHQSGGPWTLDSAI